MKLKSVLSACTLSCMLALSALSAQASVVVGGTRVVYPANEREVSLKITNEGQKPALVQSWVDAGDPRDTPQTTKAPFVVTPPIFRLDAKKTQTVRVVYTQAGLPQDRESMFWLNVLDVPPRVAQSDDVPNSLQLAFRTRIKLFFRPVGLAGDANEAAAKVTWKFVRRDGGHYALEATNPTPYHVNFTTLTARSGASNWTDDHAGTVEPNGTARFDLGNISPASDTPDEVTYTFINDFGAGVSGTAPGRTK